MFVDRRKNHDTAYRKDDEHWEWRKIQMKQANQRARDRKRKEKEGKLKRNVAPPKLGPGIDLARLMGRR